MTLPPAAPPGRMQDRSRTDEPIAVRGPARHDVEAGIGSEAGRPRAVGVHDVDLVIHVETAARAAALEGDAAAIRRPGWKSVVPRRGGQPERLRAVSLHEI